MTFGLGVGERLKKNILYCIVSMCVLPKIHMQASCQKNNFREVNKSLLHREKLLSIPSQGNRNAPGRYTNIELSTSNVLCYFTAFI